MNKKFEEMLIFFGIKKEETKDWRAKEPAKIVGLPKIFKVYSDGSKELVYEEENLITTAAKKELLKLLYMTSITTDPITSLKIGTGGAVDSQGLYPKVEDPTATGLNTPIYTVATTYTLSTTDVSVTFLGDIDQSTANGQNITEAGLFKQSGLIFNIKNFPAIPKTSDFAIHFEWTIKYA